MRRVDLQVDDFEWNEFNRAKLAAHNITTQKIDEVLQVAPEFFINFPGRSAEFLMIGPDLMGRFTTRRSYQRLMKASGMWSLLIESTKGALGASTVRREDKHELFSRGS